jgi:hypothetical protein
MLVDVPVPMMPPGFNLTVAANLADDQNFVPLLTLFTASHMARPELNPHRSAHTDAVWRRTYCADINPLLTSDLSVELSRGPNRRTSPAVPGATCRNRATRPEARDARCQRHDRWRLEDGARARGGRVYPAAQPGVFRGSNVEGSRFLGGWPCPPFYSVPPPSLMVGPSGAAALSLVLPESSGHARHSQSGGSQSLSRVSLRVDSIWPRSR